MKTLNNISLSIIMFLCLVGMAIWFFILEPIKKWFIANFLRRKQRFMMYEWMYNFIMLGSDDVGYCWALTEFQNKHKYCNRYEMDDLKELMDYEPVHRGDAYWFPKTPEGKKIRLAILSNILYQK